MKFYKKKFLSIIFLMFFSIQSIVIGKEINPKFKNLALSTETNNIQVINNDPFFPCILNNKNSSTTIINNLSPIILSLTTLLEENLNCKKIHENINFITRDMHTINEENILKSTNINNGIIYTASNFKAGVIDLKLFVNSETELTKEYIQETLKNKLKNHAYFEYSETGGDAENINPGILSIYGPFIDCKKINETTYGLHFQIHLDPYGQDSTLMFKNTLDKIKKDLIKDTLIETITTTKKEEKKYSKFEPSKPFDKEINMIIVGPTGRIGRNVVSMCLEDPKVNLYLAYNWPKDTAEKQGFLKSLIGDKDNLFYFYKDNLKLNLDIETIINNEFNIYIKKSYNLPEQILYKVSFKDNEKIITFKNNKDEIIKTIPLIAKKDGTYISDFSKDFSLDNININTKIPTCLYFCTGGDFVKVEKLKSIYKSLNPIFDNNLFIHTSAPFTYKEEKHKKFLTTNSFIYGVSDIKTKVNKAKELCFSGGSCTTTGLVGTLLGTAVSLLKIQHEKLFNNIIKKLKKEKEKEKEKEKGKGNFDVDVIDIYNKMEKKGLDKTINIDLIMDTTHSLTQSQKPLLKTDSKTPEAHDAIQSSSTNAKESTKNILHITSLKSLIAIANRVPINVGSVINLSLKIDTNKKITKEKFESTLKNLIDTYPKFRTSLGYSNEINNNKDIIYSTSGGIIDLSSIKISNIKNKNMTKNNSVFIDCSIFYNNEYGFTKQKINEINETNSILYNKNNLSESKKEFKKIYSEIKEPVIDLKKEQNKIKDPFYENTNNVSNEIFEGKCIKGRLGFIIAGTEKLIKDKLNVSIDHTRFDFITREMQKINAENHFELKPTIVKKEKEEIYGNTYTSQNFKAGVIDLKLFVTSKIKLTKKDIQKKLKKELKDHAYFEYSETSGDAENINTGIISIYEKSIECELIKPIKIKTEKDIFSYAIHLQLRFNPYGKDPVTKENRALIFEKTLNKIKENLNDKDILTETISITKIKKEICSKFESLEPFKEKINLIIFGPNGRIGKNAVSMCLNDPNINLYFSYKYPKNDTDKINFLKGLVCDKDTGFYFKNNEKINCDIYQNKNSFIIYTKKTLDKPEQDLYQVDFIDAIDKNTMPLIRFTNLLTKQVKNIPIISKNDGNYYKKTTEIPFEKLNIDTNIPTCVYYCTGSDKISILKQDYNYIKEKLGKNFFIYISSPFKDDPKEKEFANTNSLIYGINNITEKLEKAKEEKVFSGGSCTTNGLVGGLLGTAIIFFKIQYKEEYLNIIQNLEKTKGKGNFDVTDIYNIIKKDHLEKLNELNIIMDTTHSITQSQPILLKTSSKTPESLDSIQVSSTGAKIAAGQILGDNLIGAFVAFANRVPTNVGSVINLSIKTSVNTNISKEDFTAEFIKLIDEFPLFRKALGYSNMIRHNKNLTLSNVGGILDLLSINFINEKDSIENIKSMDSMDNIEDIEDIENIKSLILNFSIWYNNENGFTTQNVREIKEINKFYTAA